MNPKSTKRWDGLLLFLLSSTSRLEVLSLPSSGIRANFQRYRESLKELSIHELVPATVLQFVNLKTLRLDRVSRFPSSFAANGNSLVIIHLAQTLEKLVLVDGYTRFSNHISSFTGPFPGVIGSQFPNLRHLALLSQEAVRDGASDYVAVRSVRHASPPSAFNQEFPGGQRFLFAC